MDTPAETPAPELQNEALGEDAANAANEVVQMVLDAAQAMDERVKKTNEALPEDKRTRIKVALEELRKVSETAAWATRMIVEINGHQKKTRGDLLSQRKLEEASGVSLATIHEWIHHPAEVIDGKSGPGTLPKPGQTRHRFARKAAWIQNETESEIEYTPTGIEFHPPTPIPSNRSTESAFMPPPESKYDGGSPTSWSPPWE